MTGERVDVTDLVERERIGAGQIRLLILCLIVICFDGFNAQVMGYAAPALIKAFHVSRAAFGPVASAGLGGLMLGTLLLGTLGDRLGRRTIIVASTAAFGLFSTLTAFAHGVGALGGLLLFRVLDRFDYTKAVPALFLLAADPGL